MDLKNRVVVHYRTGRLLKGFTWDFMPTKESFHLADVADERKITEIPVKDLKAVFFVKSFEGDRKHEPDYTLESFRSIPGIKLKVCFSDGETLYGTSNAYSPARKGFFLLPADTSGNNERVFIVTDAARVEQVKEGAPASPSTAPARK
jgi:hypothetical protein